MDTVLLCGLAVNIATSVRHVNCQWSMHCSAVYCLLPLPSGVAVQLRFPLVSATTDKRPNKQTFPNFYIFFIVAPCILRIHLVSHTNKCTSIACFHVQRGTWTGQSTYLHAHGNTHWIHSTHQPMICCHTHYTTGMFIFIVILAGIISDPWGWHAICCRNMSEQ